MSATQPAKRRAPRTAGNGRGAVPERERQSFLLAKAAQLMAHEGYHHTSMRDVARAASYSLAGLYHYFESKEDLLFQVQERVFASLLAEQERGVAAAPSLEAKLDVIVRNHLAFFTRHAAELKVCTFELQSLRGNAYRRIEELRRAYYRLVADVVEGLLRRRGRAADADAVRHATLLVFGSLNWMFMWFDPERDAPSERLGDEIVRFALHGLSGSAR